MFVDGFFKMAGTHDDAFEKTSGMAEKIVGGVKSLAKPVTNFFTQRAPLRQAAMKTNVLQNIRESRAARAASGFDKKTMAPKAGSKSKLTRQSGALGGNDLTRARDAGHTESAVQRFDRRAQEAAQKAKNPQPQKQPKPQTQPKQQANAQEGEAAKKSKDKKEPGFFDSIEKSPGSHALAAGAGLAGGALLFGGGRRRRDEYQG